MVNLPHRACVTSWRETFFDADRRFMVRIALKGGSMEGHDGDLPRSVAMVNCAQHSTRVDADKLGESRGQLSWKWGSDGCYGEGGCFCTYVQVRILVGGVGLG
jgi:hypothetical protein